MKKISVCLLVLLIVSSYIVGNTAIETKQIEMRENSNPISIEKVNQSEINSIIEKNIDQFAILDFSIFGYLFTPELSNVFSYDTSGSLLMTQRDSKFVEISVNTSFGHFNFSALINAEFYSYLDDTYKIRYTINDLNTGYFSEVLFLKDKILVNIAFESLQGQLIYDGVISCNNYGDLFFVEDYEKYEYDKPLSSPLLDSVNDVKSYLIQKQKTSTVVSDKKQKLEQTSMQNRFSLTGDTYTTYGISHEGWDFTLDYPETLPDLWEDETDIDIGIYQYKPSETLIKSDLVTYNKDTYNSRTDTLTARDILAYNMVSHGGPFWKIDGDVFIYPSEIEDLWDYWTSGYYEYDVYPDEMIVMVDACCSYSTQDEGECLSTTQGGPYDDPTMGEAFVDYGAEAFAGSTILIPADSDDFMTRFWEEMTDIPSTIFYSLYYLCIEYGSPWNVGDEWKIYGDDTSRIPPY